MGKWQYTDDPGLWDWISAMAFIFAVAVIVLIILIIVGEI